MNFVEQEVENDMAAGRTPEGVITRFPPEPNGYLHIGHAKAIWVDFGIAEKFGGRCNLRFDDTNPAKESQEFVDSIKDDIRWLGYDWQGHEYYASDYFEALYGFAVQLIEKGLAYVCDLSAEETRSYRGTPHEPGKNSPNRDRSTTENLALFKSMRDGEFPDGACTLRAKIDMAHANLNMRDPVLYRIARAHHHRTGDAWCIYPMYDFAHGQSDAIEGVTHSLCSLEFENHRPLYEWFLEHIDGIGSPRQIEFARLNLTYTITSKRKLQELVEKGYVTGWDDPRMPTIRGLRKRGYTPDAIRNMCAAAGLTKFNALHDMHLLENALREDLNKRADRRMAVLDPLKVVITNLAEDEAIECEAVNNPEAEGEGTSRTLHLTREIWIEQEDFREDAPSKFFRLKANGDVRLRYGYVIHCDEIIKDDAGNVVELRCTYDPESGGGKTPEGKKKVKGIIHWVSARDAVDAEVRLYDHLFKEPQPGTGGRTIEEDLNPDSIQVVQGAKLEPALSAAAAGTQVQFERLGYFVRTDDEDIVFNRAVSLRDSWAKFEQKG
ncbi:Glutamine--tRNA ligase [Planctomycetes bacterium Poly30]|uniref:Glutamine--tRNA ligase n=2 Tax=Saltatorellus ferox TaxID=2528018 RepID=A0A518EN38_9BACT|nr:Glutamine--tRNA ligase [Planctomycetes bacterium Poly30]